jgi:hypothetical protein
MLIELAMSPPPVLALPVICCIYFSCPLLFCSHLHSAAMGRWFGNLCKNG